MPGHQERRPGAEPRLGPLIAVMALFAALGSPLVFFVWEAINHVLAGDVAGARLGRGAVAAVALAVVLAVLVRVLRRAAPNA